MHFLFKSHRYLLGLVFFIFIFSLTSYSQKPVYKGLLWEISGNGLKKPSYLYGTMHVSNKIAFHLTDSFFIALKNVDLVALEINPETFMQDLMKTPDYASSSRWTGETFNDFYKRAFAPASPDNKAIARILAQEHGFANYLLYRSMGRKENFEENTYLDLFIFQAGKKLNKKVCGLEDVGLTRELNIRAMMKDEEEETKRETGYSGRDVSEKIQDAYRAGDLDMLDSLQSLVSTKNYIELMLYYRNELMAKKMDSIMKYQSMFAGVGAAHLPGEKGMIELLRKKGYTVRAVKNVQKKSDQMKDKIEQTICKVNCSDQVCEDSLFRVSLPGNMLSEVKDLFNKDKSEVFCKEYFFPDMANGTYYAITRINTFAPLYGLSKESLMKKIDSLLYENIPGKIITKKVVSYNGLPAYDIVNRTRKGDLQRYFIVVSPLEMIVFKLTGVGEYVSKEGDKFFSSIKLVTATGNNWKTYRAPGNAFNVSMPGEIIVQNNSELTRGSTPEYLIQSVDNAGNYYFLMKTTYNDFEYIEEDSFELSTLAKGFYKPLKYTPYNQKFISYNSLPALDVQLSNDKKKDIQIRVIISGPNYYLLGVKSADSTLAEKYFKTFSVSDFVYKNKFETYKDTNLFFQVQTPVTPVPLSSYRRMYSSYSSKNKKKDNSHQGFYRTNFYVHNPTSEVIKVETIKFHTYRSYKDLKEFWEIREKLLTNDGSLISKKVLVNNDQERNIILTDTNSVRAIKVKMILKEGVLYTISTNIDTIRKPSEFVQTFYQSFLPADTILGQSIIVNKGDKLIETFATGDSTKIAQALNSLDYVKFEDKHAPGLIKVFKSFDFSKVSKKPEDDKLAILQALGTIKSKEVNPFLKELYIQASDTFSYQMGVLKSLARQKTPDSYKNIVDLLQSDIPLASESDIKGLFRVIKDSLKMSVHLYPKILEFTRYAEYKNSIYELLAILVDSNYIKPSAYVSYKEDIIRDARDEVKRRHSSTKGYYKSYSSYDYSFSSKKIPSIKDNLYSYAILVMPYYNEQPVTHFFERLKKLKDDDLLMRSYVLLLKNKKDVLDTVWTYYCKDENRRLDMYTYLKDANRLDKFDSKYLNQESIARALLCQSGFDSKKDTLAFLEKRKVKSMGKEGYVYYFKRKSKESRIWKLDYVGLQPSDSSKVESEYIVKEKGVSFTPAELKEIIDNSVEDMEVKGRKRIGRKRRYSDYYDDDFF